LRCQAVAQPGDGCLRAPVQIGIHADKREQRYEQYGGFGKFPDDQKYCAGAEQEPEHGIFRRVAQNIPPASLRRFNDAVIAILLPPRFYLPIIETVLQ
jgi:hypothetical protein